MNYQQNIQLCEICSEVKTVAERLQNKIIAGMDPADAWNELSVDLVRCAKVGVAPMHIKEENNIIVLVSVLIVRKFVIQLVSTSWLHLWVNCGVWAV